MSLLLLKKKIEGRISYINSYCQELHIAKTVAEGHSLGKRDGYRDILYEIDELEKEEAILKSNSEKELFIQLAERLKAPVWSGRSEKEIRERMGYYRTLKEAHEKYLNQPIDTVDVIEPGHVFGFVYAEGLRQLEWVLSPSQKKEVCGNWECYKEMGHPGECTPVDRTKIAPRAGVSSAPKEKCGHKKNGRVCVMPKDHQGKTEHSDKKVYWDDSAEPKVYCESPGCGELSIGTVQKKWLCQQHWIIEKSKVYSQEEVSREEKPKPALLIAKENFEYWDTFGLLSELATWEHIQENITPEQNASYIQGRIDSYRSAVNIARKVPVFTLAEIADLIEKIEAHFKQLEKEMGIEAFVEMALKEYEGILHLWECDKSPGYYWPSDINWPRLFREKPDLVERIRKGGN